MAANDLLKNYAQPPVQMDPRMVEAWGLTQAALQLRAAMEGGDEEEMRQALRVNWRLWTIFQAELLSPDCPLPAELRANVLSLAAFVDKRTTDLLADTRPEAIEVLVSINRELAMGLYESCDAHAAAPKEDKPAEKSAMTISI